MPLPALAAIALNIAISLVLTGISVLIAGRKSSPTPAATTLDQFRVPRTDEGRAWPIIDGRAIVRDGQVLGTSQLRVEAVKTKSGK